MSKFWTAFAAKISCINWKGGAELHHRCGEQLQKSEEIELRKNGARCDERLSEGKKRGKNRLQARAAVFKGFSMGTCQKLHSDEQHWQYPKRFIKEMNAEIALFTWSNFLTGSRIPIGVVCSSSAPDFFSDFSLDLILILKCETIHVYTTTSEAKQKGLDGTAYITRFWVPSELNSLSLQSNETKATLPALSTPSLLVIRKGRILKQFQEVAAMKFCNCNSALYYDCVLLCHYILGPLLSLL